MGGLFVWVAFLHRWPFCIGGLFVWVAFLPGGLFAPSRFAFALIPALVSGQPLGRLEAGAGHVVQYCMPERDTQGEGRDTLLLLSATNLCAVMVDDRHHCTCRL